MKKIEKRISNNTHIYERNYIEFLELIMFGKDNLVDVLLEINLKQIAAKIL